MPNNFKLTGDYYVSKAGNDANSGTSPDAPKRTVQAGLNLLTSGTKTLIIGAGVYREAIRRDTNSMIYSVIADGKVVLEALNPGYSDFIINNANQNGFTYDGIEFRNFNLVQFNSVSNTISNCVFKNTNNIYCINTNIFLRCILINCITSGTPSFNYSILINSSTPNSSLITNSYSNATSNLVAASGITANNFNYNNIQGAITMNVASSVTSGVIQDTFSRYYDLSQAGNGGSGSLAEPYKRGDTILKPFNFSNHRIAYPTMNASSSAVDPKFNSIEDQDFTLQASSWHIGRASDGISNIGGTNYALRRTSRISFSGSQATVDPSLIFQYDNYIISGSEVTGSVTSAPIAVNTATPKVIQKVTYNGLLAFNKDTGSASGSNQNVPDFDTFTSASGNAAANPDRLVYYMRHTTGSSIPVTDANWDNGGLWTAGQYNVFEWNTKPSIDNNGVGNGSGSFNAAVTPTFIQATYVQMQVKLRNDYLL